MTKTYEIFAAGTPHYTISERGCIYEAMQEALRLENKSGLRGAFMIRTLWDGVVHSIAPAFMAA